MYNATLMLYCASFTVTNALSCFRLYITLTLFSCNNVYKQLLYSILLFSIINCLINYHPHLRVGQLFNEHIVWIVLLTPSQHTHSAIKYHIELARHIPFCSAFHFNGASHPRLLRNCWFAQQRWFWLLMSFSFCHLHNCQLIFSAICDIFCWALILFWTCWSCASILLSNCRLSKQSA